MQKAEEKVEAMVRSATSSVVGMGAKNEVSSARGRETESNTEGAATADAQKAWEGAKGAMERSEKSGAREGVGDTAHEGEVMVSRGVEEDAQKAWEGAKEAMEGGGKTWEGVREAVRESALPESEAVRDATDFLTKVSRADSVWIESVQFSLAL